MHQQGWFLLRPLSLSRWLVYWIQSPLLEFILFSSMSVEYPSPNPKFLSSCSLFKTLGSFEITSPLSDTHMPCSSLILQHLWKIGVWEWWLLSWVLLWLNMLVSHSTYWLCTIVLWDKTVRLPAPEVQKQGTNPLYYHFTEYIEYPVIPGLCQTLASWKKHIFPSNCFASSPHWQLPIIVKTLYSPWVGIIWFCFILFCFVNSLSSLLVMAYTSLLRIYKVENKQTFLCKCKASLFEILLGVSRNLFGNLKAESGLFISPWILLGLPFN